MEHKFVQFTVDVGAKRHPGAVLRYRAYINDELFTERSWIWREQYLEEYIPIQASPGHYTIRYELVEPEHARIKVHNLRVITGPGTVNDRGCVHIHTTPIAQ